MRTFFVFGSNLNGWHGKGAALCARREYGVVYGCGVGFQGDSYAIPTKGRDMKPLPLPVIKFYVDEFLQRAEEHPDWIFTLTRVGCGLAGYRDEDIAPMFAEAPANVLLPSQWERNEPGGMGSGMGSRSIAA